MSKKFLTSIALCCLALCAAPAWAQPHCHMPGDINGDGVVDGGDIGGYVHCFLGQPPPGADCICIDINQDGQANLLDVNLFVRVLLGGDVTPDMGACCTFEHPHCFIVSRNECNGMGGTFHGPGSTCGGDLNNNETPDRCETDCDGNGMPDDHEIAMGMPDCDGNGIPDMCDPDCNGNQIPDICELNGVMAVGQGTFVDIRQVGTALNLLDDQIVAITLPFTNYFLTSPNGHLSNNGAIGLGGIATLGFTNTPIPSAAAFGGAQVFYAYWDDLFPSDVGGNVYIATLGSAPNRTFVAMWDRVRHFSSPPGQITFEIQIYESPIGGVVARYLYSDVVFDGGASDQGGSATIGYQLNGAIGTQWSFNQRGAVQNGAVLTIGALPDCNANRIPDACDINSGLLFDCNQNGLPDDCELSQGAVADCNLNHTPDSCDIARGTSQDCDGNATPDECERCTIPGDMNGDRLVNDADQNAFLACFNRPCDNRNCECADMNGDGRLDTTDQILFIDVISGQMPQQTMAIDAIRPMMIGTADIVEIDGFGFGQNPDNLCLVVMPDSSDGGMATTAIPLQALAIQQLGGNRQRIMARVGAVAAFDRPGVLMIALGRGINGQFPLEAPGAIAPQGGWRWQFGGQVMAAFDFAQLPFLGWITPIPYSCYNHCITGTLQNNQLCIDIDRGYPKGSQLQIECRAWDHTVNPHFGVDGYIPNLTFTVDKDPNQSAMAICAAIQSLYAAQTPPVTINCSITPLGGGAVRLCIFYPNRPISWGRFSICGPYVEMQVNNTPATNDDYVTWAPTYCRARIVGLDPAIGMPTNVVLVNDNPNPAGAGNLRFAAFTSPWPFATTATALNLTLTLPPTGAFVPFVIAGEFGNPSTADKDAIMEARLNIPTGGLLGRHCLMVRVRKNGNNLTNAERDRYVNAILALHAAGGYKVFQDIHAIAGSQAHGSPAFLPWHRALVLEYERALQTKDPSVAANYWVYNVAAPNIFNNSFMGATSGAGQVVTGPFAGWTIDAMNPIMRSAGFAGAAAPVATDASVLAAANFIAFKAMEGTSHNGAHGHVGGWMGSVSSAVRDPTFFLLHSNVERLYCKWQSMGHHGNGPNEYDPQGAFICGTSTYRLGAHLLDTMWPWNGIVGVGACPGFLDDRPASAPGGALNPPAAPGYMLGPPAMPTIDNVLDYLGRVDPIVGLGFCYDDTMYN